MSIEIIAKSKGTNESLGIISDEYFQKLKREIHIKRIDGLEDSIRTMVSSAGWKGDHYEQITRDIIRILVENNIEINRDKFREFSWKKLNHKLDWYENIIDHNFVVSLKDEVYRELDGVISNVDLFLKEVWRINFLIDRVAVGPGEVFLTLFSNARKGSTGDLMIDSKGEIELKSNGGRLGTSNYTHQVPKTLSAILEHYDYSIKDGKFFLEIKDDLRRKHKKIYQRLEKIKQYVDNNNKIDSLTKRFTISNLSLVQRLFDKDPEALADLHTIQTQLKVTLNHKQQSKYIDQTINLIYDYISLRSKFDQYIQSKDPQYTPKSKELNWNEAVKSFFCVEWNIPVQSIIDGFLSTRTEGMFEYRANLEHGIRLSVTPDIIKSIHSGSKKELINFLLAIQLTSYQHVSKFDYLSVVNDKEFDIYTFKFNRPENVKDNYLNTYTAIRDNDRFDTQIAVDKVNKGLQLILK